MLFYKPEKYLLPNQQASGGPSPYQQMPEQYYQQQ
jgi:hypothetical protein